MHGTKREPVASRPISSYQTGVGMLMAKELFEEGVDFPAGRILVRDCSAFGTTPSIGVWPTIEDTIRHFGRIKVVVNNAPSARPYHKHQKQERASVR